MIEFLIGAAAGFIIGRYGLDYVIDYVKGWFNK